MAAEGGVSALIALVTSSVAGVQEQACAALWNLGLNRANLPPFTTSLRDIANNSEIITNEGAIKVMIRILDNAHVELQRLAAGVLRCLAYMYEPNRVNIANEGGIVHLCRLLASPSLKVQQQAAAALGNLTYRNAPNRVAVAQDGGIRPLIVLLASKSSEVQLMAATTVRNLALNDENRILIARCGGIPQLVSLLECSKPDIQVQTAAALWNLALNGHSYFFTNSWNSSERLCRSEQGAHLQGQGARSPLGAYALRSNGRQVLRQGRALRHGHRGGSPCMKRPFPLAHTSSH